MDMEQIARVCHEANRAYCKAMGDDSHQPWDDAPDWQRNSAVAGVRAVVEGQVFDAEQLHRNWMRDKMADGWKWGKVKDAEQKTHPGMVPFAELPESERKKDTLFANIVKALAWTTYA